MKRCILLCTLMLLMCAAAFAQKEELIMLQVEEHTDISFRLSEAVRTADENAVIVIPAGEYYVSGTVRLRSGIIIEGQGMDKTTLTINKNGVIMLFKADGKENITLRNLSVNGMSLNTKHILVADNCKNITVDSISVRDLEGTIPAIAIQFIGTTDSVVQNCTFTNISLTTEWGCAVRLSHGSSRNTITHNIIENTGRGGILCDNNSEYLTITHNTITGSGKTSEGLSIELWSNCGYSVVEDNRVDHWLSLDSAPYTAIRRNTISDKSGEVKFLGLETVGSCNIVLTDNVVDHGQYIGISASNVAPKEYAYWGNNQVYGCEQWGAQFQGEEGYVRYQYFYNLTLADTFQGKDAIYPGSAGSGFRFNDFCESFIFEGGRIYGNAKSAIMKLGKVNDVYFIDTKIYDNGDDDEADTAKMRLTLDALPKAVFTCETAVQAGEPVMFTNQSSGNTSEIAHMLWDFGAGIPSTEENPVYTYAAPGEYTVTLIVWNEQGLGGRCGQKITVR